MSNSVDNDGNDPPRDNVDSQPLRGNENCDDQPSPIKESTQGTMEDEPSLTLDESFSCFNAAAEDCISRVCRLLQGAHIFSTMDGFTDSYSSTAEHGSSLRHGSGHGLA